MLDEVRPYLMADGGNVSVIEIDGLVVRLRLEGACGSCPSSTTTMRMGIEVRRRWDILQPHGISPCRTSKWPKERIRTRVCLTTDERRPFLCARVPPQRRLMERIPEIMEVEEVIQENVGLELNDENVELVLDEIRPYLVGTGGGELELKSIDDMIVQVGLAGPAASVSTVRVAITQKLRERIPAIAAVRLS